MESNLKKSLNSIDIFCLSTGAMISSGLFVLPGLAHQIAGPAVILSYFISGLFALTGTLSIAELATAMPKAGGDYFFIARTLGPAVGTIAGLLSWFSLSLKSAFALIGMAAFTTLIINIDIHIIAITLCIIFVCINIVGIREASNTQVILVSGLLFLIVIYLIKGFPKINIRFFEPFFKNKSVSNVFTAAGFVFVSYGGLLKIASIAEEVKEPGKNIPYGMLSSLILTSIIYSLVVFVTVGILPSLQLESSLTPISDAANLSMGYYGKIALSVAAVFAFISTANAGIMAASRYPFSLSRDGLLPAFLTKTHKKFKTPYISILLTGLFIIVALTLNLDILVKVASTVLIVTYILSNASIIILRESKLQNYSPEFKSPFYPYVQIMGIIAFLFLIFEMGKAALIITGSLALLSIIFYIFYGRLSAKKEYALLYLIERIISQDFTEGSLETELKEIIRERDNIKQDRFDEIITKSLVLDIDKKLNFKELFQLASKTLSDTLSIPESVLYSLLLKREKESSTVISPFLAIPHIVIEGQNKFSILLVRSKKGIIFDNSSPVYAVFIIAGTKDERNFHLRTLSAIAQIVQDPDFENKWLNAKNEDALRDIMLLSKRKRNYC